MKLDFRRTIENYKRRAQCIVDQYSSYLVKSINKTVSDLLSELDVDDAILK